MGCPLGFLFHKKISIGWILVERFGAPSDRRTRSRRSGHHARPRSFSLSEMNKLQGKLWPNFLKFGIHDLRRLNETSD
eukprot:332623-Pleurochrysis_carterae.AAC.1